MRRAEAVVLAFRALGETRESAALPQSAYFVAARGQDLVWIGLVADIPDQAVAWRVEQVVERDGQLDHAQSGAEVSPGYRNRVDRLSPQLVGHLAKLLFVEPPKVGGRVDRVEDWRR